MRRTIVMTAVITLLGLAPAAAATTTTDAVSDHATLTAYDRYLHDLVSSVPAWRRANDAFVESVFGGCANVLAGLSKAPSGTVDETALFNFGVEIGGDLAVVGVKADRAPLAKLTRAVSSLAWSTPKSAAIVRRFAATQRRLLNLAPSHLCDDARALAASNGAKTPPGTTRFLDRFVGDTTEATKWQSALGTMLRQFESPTDSGLVHDIANLDRRLSARLDKASTPEVRKIVSVLGLPS